MKLSLLLPTYNRVDKIRELIGYLKREKVFSNDNIEVIISNNASTDQTRLYLEGVKESNLQIYHQNENLGLAGNIRFLTGIANGEYIWIMGDNDYFVSGAIDKIMATIDDGVNVAHVFLNYGYVDGNGNMLQIGVYKGVGKYYSNGFEMLFDVVGNVNMGAMMFISSNVYRKDIIDKVNSFVLEQNEKDNLALPLGYALYSCEGEGMCISDVYVYNESDTSSTWSDREILVYNRDMIAIFDKVSHLFQNYKELREFHVNHFQSDFPEYKYMLYGRKFKRDNYAMKLLLRYYPLRVIKDALVVPGRFIKYRLAKHKNDDGT